MADDKPKLSGPDLSKGVAQAKLADGAMLLGHAGGEAVLLARRGQEIFAVGAVCTHYGGPLVDGLLVDDTVRCPWHHACFSLRSGEALRAPALKPVARWHVEERAGKIHVGKKLRAPPRRRAPAGGPKAIVIVGGGAAGHAAAEMLRREGFAGRLTMLSADRDAPYDRPILSKDYLAGSATEDWIPLRPRAFYKQHDIALKLGAEAVAIDKAARQVRLKDGSRHRYDALLLATGAAPVLLKLPGAKLPHVHYLRSLADSRALIAAAGKAKRAVVVGASFIGLEVAASLRARKVAVQIVAPEARPLERILGPEIGDFLRGLHEKHGVRFHLDGNVSAIDAKGVTLAGGVHLPADLVVVGIGVRPITTLAESAGIATDRGIAVDEYLETSVPGIFAAGDIARWPDRLTGERIRVEHWVVAERQGQTAARNMLGRRQPFDAVPYFWSQHYDMAICYTGHAESWDRIETEGRVAAQDCKLTYRRGGRTLAVATIGRDLENLQAERALESAVAGRLAR